MASVLNLELSKHHVCSLIDLFWVHGEADLIWVLCDKGLTILPQLLEGLALTLGLRLASFAFGACSLLNEGLEAELNSNSHKVRVLCEITVSFHDISQLELLILSEQNTPSIFNPNNLGLCLLVNFDEGAAQDEHLVLQRVSQITRLVTLIL